MTQEEKNIIRSCVVRLEVYAREGLSLKAIHEELDALLSDHLRTEDRSVGRTVDAVSMDTYREDCRNETIEDKE